jgi:hypothetical protein
MPEEETVTIILTAVPDGITALLAIAKAQALEEKTSKSKFYKFPTASKNETPFRDSPVSRDRGTNSEINNFGQEVVYLYEYCIITG